MAKLYNCKIKINDLLDYDVSNLTNAKLNRLLSSIKKLQNSEPAHFFEEIKYHLPMSARIIKYQMIKSIKVEIS